MGSQQSRVTDSELASEKLIVERLQALEVKQQGTEDSEYVSVEDNEKQTHKDVSKSPSLVISTVEEWQHELLQDPKNRLALSALSSGDLKAILTSRTIEMADQQVFNVKIPFEGAPITNQRSSGRCWLFAATNVFRVPLMKRYNLEKFELSQAYLFFWDKLEKANFFLEQILDTSSEDLDSRLIQTLLSSPVSDGGQFDMAYNLVKKYGLVPQVLYPDSFNAKSSSAINSLITTKLREDALTLRNMSSASASAYAISITKEKMMREIHLILTLTLGPPPAPDADFTWTYLDKSGKAQELKSTPIAFAKEMSSPMTIRSAGINVDRMFSLVNDPRNDYNTHLTVSRLNNIFSPSARPITYVNVSMSVLKTACIAMLKAGQPIFFGSDVGKFSNSTSGIMDTGLIDYKLGFNVQLGLKKKDRLITGESAMTHAMVLTAVHLDYEGNSVRWRVQNSWGETAGSDGWFVMSDRWMDEFVYQAVVEPKFVSREVRDVLKQKAKVLPLWDPMGALA